jgi:hypothetical protein
MSRALLVVLFAVTSWAQITAPVLGYVQQGPGIRVLHGIPAAGFVGGMLDTGVDLALIRISPRQDYILATAADTGQVLTIVPGSPAIAIPAATRSPDSLTMSPRGSSAALYYSAANQIQIVSGLPASPSVRTVDVSFLTLSLPTIAVSDDGKWLAFGSYLFAGDGSLGTIPVADPITDLAFFSNQSTLAVLTTTSVETVSSGVAQTILTRTLTGTPTGGLALSFDNSRLVFADIRGSITSIDLATNLASVANCACAPQGLFGMGGAIFLLTNSAPGGAKLFDAANNRILSVPELPSEVLTKHSPPAHRILPRALPPLPAVTIGGLPASSGPGQQPAMTISLGSPYSGGAVSGVATLTFVSSVGGADQTVQFASGGGTANFTIPAGSTQATFSGAPSVGVMTGTTAGTLTITLSFNVSGTDITPSPAPTASITLITTVPFIQTVQLVQGSTTSSFSVVITGFSTTRDITIGMFNFAPATVATLATAEVTVQLGTPFSLWYQNPASSATGSEFTLTVPFFTAKGPAADIVAVTVTLTNSKGMSNPAVNQ